MLRKIIFAMAMLAPLIFNISCGKFSRLNETETGFTTVKFEAPPRRSAGDLGINATLNGAMLVYIVGQSAGLPKKPSN